MRSGTLFKSLLIGILVLSTGVFAFFKAHDLLLGGRVSIDTPKSGTTLRDPFVVIKGEAPGNTLLTLNGAKIIADEKGHFEKELLLGLGYNVIEVKALDRFNREKKATLELVYKPAAPDKQVTLKW